MFSYTCEKCGREVPPAYSECPDCASKAAASPLSSVAVAEAPVPLPLPVAPVQTIPQAPLPMPPQPMPQAPPPVQQPNPQPMQTSQRPARSGGQPGWVIALLVAGVLGLGGYILIDKGLPMWRGRNGAATLAPAVAVAPAADAPQVKHTKAVAAPAAPDATRYLQITGLRITEANHKPQISMVVVNHAAAELVDVKANVLIHTTKDGADATPLAKLELKLGSIGGNEVRDVTMPFPTKLRAYELPDWQFLVATLEPAN